MKEQQGSTRKVRWSNMLRELSRHLACFESDCAACSAGNPVPPQLPPASQRGASRSAAHLSLVSVNSTCRCTRGSYLQRGVHKRR